jgi:hypothetical protein
MGKRILYLKFNKLSVLKIKRTQRKYTQQSLEILARECVLCVSLCLSLSLSLSLCMNACIFAHTNMNVYIYIYSLSRFTDITINCFKKSMILEKYGEKR